MRKIGALTTLILATALPASADEGAWRILQTALFEEVEDNRGWWVNKLFPEELRAQTDRFEITGYLVPVVPQAYLESFLLVETPAACPFCGPDSTPQSVIEVTMRTPLPDMAEFSRITLRGQLELDESTMTTQLFRLTDAVAVE